MPKGEGQSGRRRGPYGPHTKGQKAEPCLSPAGAWSEDDRKHYDELVAASPLKIESAKNNAARRATELARQIRHLDSRPRTVDEEKVLVSSSSQYRKWLEILKVTEPVVDDPEDEF